MTDIRRKLDIPYIKLRFQTTVVENGTWPANKVSALRGGMGEMILRQNCIADRKCETCRYKKSCIVRNTVYTPMERKPSYVNSEESVGYLIECSNYKEKYEAGDNLNFNLILFGNSVVYFNIYLQAFYTLGMSGVGKNNGKYRIDKVLNTFNEPIVDGASANMSYYKIETIADRVSKRLEYFKKQGNPDSIEFKTPLCMKYRSEEMDEYISEAIYKGIFRRIEMLDYYVGIYDEQADIEEYPEIISQAPVSRSVKRYSNTHQSHMSLNGIEGNVRFKDLTEEQLMYLIVGELIHLGKNTSFGCGKYEIGG